jgi:DNA polymerase-3 subunit alpha
VNKKSIEALVKCGALDSSGASRKGMLAALETAQAAGQKAQQDALIGQGSIFDLGADAADPNGGGTTGSLTRPTHPPMLSEEFDRTELLAAEKEALGLFVSAHPLKAVRPALRAKVDCTLADLGGRRDGDWVTVGGIITHTKRIRTKKGDPMMFATLDDLEGTVELLVFGKVLAAADETLAPDRIVTVRGKVDHRDATSTCVIAQEVATFEPTADEVAAAETRAAAAVTVRAPLHLRVDAARLPAGVIGDLKHLLQDFPGEAEVVLEMQTAGGARRLRLGPEYRVTPSSSLRASLDQLLGDAALAA